MVTHVLEAETESAGTHLTEPELGFQGTPFLVKKVDRVPIPLGKSRATAMICFLPWQNQRCTAYLNSFWVWKELIPLAPWRA